MFNNLSVRIRMCPKLKYILIANAKPKESHNNNNNKVARMFFFLFGKQIFNIFFKCQSQFVPVAVNSYTLIKRP